MRDRTALFFLVAGLLVLAALLGGCTSEDTTVAAQPTPDLSVNISVPYATTTPTVSPTGPASPFALDSSGKVTILDSKWVDGGFVSADKTAATETYYTQLRVGDQGQEVINLQTRLKELNYYAGEVTGVFDVLTQDAVELFELTYGTMQTGIATSSMQTLLYADTAPKYGSEDYDSARANHFETLQQGDMGSSVLALQYRLQELGYPLENATGEFDEATAAAVSLFYQAYGFPANDVAIVSMQKELFSENARAYAQTTAAVSVAADASSGEPVLSEGNIGTVVTQLQTRLIELGYLEGPASGTFDAATTAAVKLFQQALGLDETGVVSESLQARLLSFDAPSYGAAADSDGAGGYTLLQEGDASDAVLRLQNRLVELGYANGTPNGRYEAATVSAVKLFQRSLSLEQTGLATADLQALLFADDAPVYEAPAATNAAGDRYYPYGLTLIDLTEGSFGDLVTYLQTRLQKLGFFTGTVDGEYGEATAEAVSAIQKAMGLEPTGEATISFQQHLYSDAAPNTDITFFKKTQSFATMRLGDSEGDVEKLQRQLWELGYLNRSDVKGSVGTFNEATQTAVMNAQQAMGYVEADGVASPEFQAFLFSKYCTLIKK